MYLNFISILISKKVYAFLEIKIDLFGIYQINQFLFAFTGLINQFLFLKSK